MDAGGRLQSGAGGSGADGGGGVSGGTSVLDERLETSGVSGGSSCPGGRLESDGVSGGSSGPGGSGEDGGGAVTGGAHCSGGSHARRGGQGRPSGGRTRRGRADAVNAQARRKRIQPLTSSPSPGGEARRCFPQLSLLPSVSRAEDKLEDVEEASRLTPFLFLALKVLQIQQVDPLPVACSSSSDFLCKSPDLAGRPTFCVCVVKAVRVGKFKLTLRGVALGDSWILLEYFASSCGMLSFEVSRLDSNGTDQANNRDAQVVRQQIAVGQFRKAHITLNKMFNWIVVSRGHVDMYNFFLDAGKDPVADASTSSPSAPAYSRYLESKSMGDSIEGAMNGTCRYGWRNLTRFNTR